MSAIISISFSDRETAERAREQILFAMNHAGLVAFHMEIEGGKDAVLSEDIEMLLAGLKVESIAELKWLVERGREVEKWEFARDTPFNPAKLAVPIVYGREDYVTAAALRRWTQSRSDLGPGWREDSSEELFYSSAWIDGPEPVFYETSRGAAERQPHGCEGQLQQ